MDSTDKGPGVQSSENVPEEEISEDDAAQLVLSQRDGIKIVLESKLIVLSPLKLEDYPFTRVLISSNFMAPTEYQSLVMAKLVNAIISRTKLTPEDTDVLRHDMLKTYHAIGAAIERALIEVVTE